MRRETALAVPVCKLSWSMDLHLFPRNSLLKCAPQTKVAKNTKFPYFGGSRSFNVIDVNTTKKLVTSAFYDKQHVCAYLQQCFHARHANIGKITTF